MAGGSNPQNVQAPQQGGQGQLAPNTPPQIQQMLLNKRMQSAGGGTAYTSAPTGGPGMGRPGFSSPKPSPAMMQQGGQMGGNPAIPAQTPQNVFQQSSAGLTGAMGGAQAAMGYQPQQVGTRFGYNPQSVGALGVGTNFGYNPQNVSAGSVGATGVGTSFGYNPQNVSAQQAAGGIGTYMNPYTQQVIDTSMADLERQRQMQQNQLGAQASAAGAFGGSRQGIAEAETNRAFAQQGGQLAAQLRQQGFQTALGASQQDVANQMQAALANQAAGGRAAEFGQQLGFQGQTANQQAAMQAALANQQTGLQAALANQAAGGRAAEFGQQLGFQGQTANQQAAMQAALANQAAAGRAAEFGQSTGLQAALANQQAGLSGANLRLSGAGQLGGLAQQGFNMGQQIGQQQFQQGQAQQLINQALIDAARAQYGGFTGAPAASLSLPLAALGVADMGQQTQTDRTRPGLLNYLSAGLGLL